MVFQDPGGLVVGRAGAPQERLGDRPVVERGGAQQVGDEFLAGGVKERVGAGVGVAVGADERVGELQRAAVRGHVAERVPPPAGLPAGELFGVEVPDLAGLLADQAGGGVAGRACWRSRTRRRVPRGAWGSRGWRSCRAAGPRCRTAGPPRSRYSGWPSLTARAIGRPSWAMLKRLAVARAFARETGWMSRPRPIIGAARSAWLRRDPLRASPMRAAQRPRARCTPLAMAAIAVAAGGQRVLPSASSSASDSGATGGGRCQRSSRAPSCTAAVADDHDQRRRARGRRRSAARTLASRWRAGERDSSRSAPRPWRARRGGCLGARACWCRAAAARSASA